VPKRRHEADDWRAHLAAVVDDLEREGEVVADLPHDDNSAEGLAEQAMCALAEHFALEARQGLRRPEAAARAADEQNAGYFVPIAYHARAWSSNVPSGEPSRRRYSSRKAACASGSSETAKSPAGPTPARKGSQRSLKFS